MLECFQMISPNLSNKTNLKQNRNMKVLLFKWKRHTACRIASTRYAVPVGGTPILTWDLDEVFPIQLTRGIPMLLIGVPPSCWQGGGIPYTDLRFRYNQSWPEMGTLPVLIWDGGIPKSWSANRGRDIPLYWPGMWVPPSWPEMYPPVLISVGRMGVPPPPPPTSRRELTNWKQTEYFPSSFGCGR